MTVRGPEADRGANRRAGAAAPAPGRDRPEGSSRRRAITRLGALVLLGLFAVPLLWVIAASFSTETGIFSGRLLDPPVVDHYRALLGGRDFWTPIRSSLIVAGCTTAATVAIGAPGAYALARLRFPGRAPVLAFVLAAGTFPQISLVSPLYVVLRALGLIDTYPGLVLPYVSFAMPVAVWLMTGFFRAIPRGVEEAARVDGAGRLRTLVEIIVPLGLPGVATAAVVTFIASWNELLLALAFTVSPERRTVPVAIALFRGQYQVPWGEVLAAMILATLPVAALVVVFQRRLVRGLTQGAMKG